MKRMRESIETHRRLKSIATKECLTRGTCQSAIIESTRMITTNDAYRTNVLLSRLSRFRFIVLRWVENPLINMIMIWILWKILFVFSIIENKKYWLVAKVDRKWFDQWYCQCCWSLKHFDWSHLNRWCLCLDFYVRTVDEWGLHPK